MPLDSFSKVFFFTLDVPINNLLNRTIPLKQLTKLAIQCDHFFFLEVIKILRYASNIHTLILRTITLDQNEHEYMYNTQTQIACFFVSPNVLPDYQYTERRSTNNYTIFIRQI